VIFVHLKAKFELKVRIQNETTAAGISKIRRKRQDRYLGKGEEEGKTERTERRRFRAAPLGHTIQLLARPLGTCRLWVITPSAQGWSSENTRTCAKITCSVGTPRGGGVRRRLTKVYYQFVWI